MKPRASLRLATASLVVALLPLSSADARGPRATLTESTCAFGTVQRGAKVRCSAKLVNAGDAPLEIVRIGLTSPDVALKAPRSVAAGESAEVPVELDTASHAGEVRVTATFFTNDPAVPLLPLEIAGQVESRLELEPTPAIFLSAFRWEAGEKEAGVTVVNRDPAPLRSVDLSAEGDSFTPRLAVVEEGRRYQVFVKLRPGAPAGKQEGRITLTTNLETIRIPVFTFLKERVFFNPTAVDFGRIRLDQVAAEPDLLDHRKVSLFVYQLGGSDFRIRVESAPPYLAIERTPAEGPGSVVDIPRQGQTAIFELALSLDAKRLVPGSFDDELRLSTNDPEFPLLVLPVHLEVR
jgi:hypothetical protein